MSMRFEKRTSLGTNVALPRTILVETEAGTKYRRCGIVTGAISYFKNAGVTTGTKEARRSPRGF